MFLPEPHTNAELAGLFFFQLVVVLVACRVFGAIVKRLGQPQVIGEMIAGIVLGPSVFGALAPEWHVRVFPAASSPIMFAVCQAALALYMFLVGAEFNVRMVRSRMGSAVSVSVIGILAPFALGALLAWAWRSGTGLFAEGVGPLQAMLFLGTAMSITALPVLARILTERRMDGTPLGTLVLGAGAANDAAAWGILAVVLGTMSGSYKAAAIAIVGGGVYAVVCLFVLRRMFRPLRAAVERRGDVSPQLLGVLLPIVLLGAWFTESIGMHAVIGAFILGLSMPRGVLVERLTEKLEPLITSLLLPLFFVYSGLHTRIGLVDSPDLWIKAGIVLAAACIGKGAACTLAARFCGESWRDSLAVGALMNARGLMELIILNIGLERGLITQRLFSIMVLMAILTTLMTTPLFEWVYRGERSARHAPG